MLNQFLITELYAFLLVFLRAGTVVMLLPGFGESYIAPRFRLLFAVMLSVLLSPMLRATLPPIPATPVALLTLSLAEIAIGLIIGSISRLLISAMQTAAAIIAAQSSMTSALVTDVMQAGQTTALSNFLTIAALAALFAADLHHVMLRGMVASYDLFTPGTFPNMSDAAALAVRTVSQSYVIAMQMAAPHLVVGTLLFLTAGILGRLMPTIQIFFLLIAPQILLGMFILMAVISAMMLWYLEYFREGVTGVMGG